ncbi:hypothetical protein Tsedi_00415 [Tepidimonas sediminis]|uniref:DUF502 domain-containing protein n=1 Tax=Tepidimonas sediminis TaxID=2588941 RepID=A0A554WT11_9BURK|nr:hypothetical protein Tsedi_00415 [Tepidimonas sediminis]
MMRRLSQLLLRGLLALLPLALTVYLLWALVVWSERLALQLLRPFIGEVYFPGLGLVLTLALILLAGLLVSSQAASRVLGWIELPFTNLPVVKSIYSSLKSFADYFAPHRHDRPAQQVVVVRPPGAEWEVVGLVTRQHTHGLPAGFLDGDRVAVYLPMGYMIGGYTVFVPRAWVNPIAMSVEEAMRQSLIAWMAPGASPPPAVDPGRRARPQEPSR